MTKQTVTMNFPCDYPIKIIGKVDDSFFTAVVTILKKHIPEFDVEMLKANRSSQGKYESLTITFNAVSKKQIDDLYIELTAHEAILMVL